MRQSNNIIDRKFRRIGCWVVIGFLAALLPVVADDRVVLQLPQLQLPNINGAKSREMPSGQLSSKKRESFQVTPEGFDLERVRATISAFERGEADSHDVSRCFGFGLDLSSVEGINQRYRAIFRVIHPDKLKSEDAEQLSVALQNAKKAAVGELKRREKIAKCDAATADAGAASKGAGEAEKRNAAEPAAPAPPAAAGVKDEGGSQGGRGEYLMDCTSVFEEILKYA